MQQKKPANRKLIYIWDENLEFFNKLPNKSATINQLIKRLRLDGRHQVNNRTTEEDQAH